MVPVAPVTAVVTAMVFLLKLSIQLELRYEQILAIVQIELLTMMMSFVIHFKIKINY